MAQFVPAGCGVPFDNFDNLKNISRMTWHLGRAQITKAAASGPRTGRIELLSNI